MAVKNGTLRQRDDFNFSIVNFPFISSNIPAAYIYIELLAPIRMSLLEDAANKEATETIVPIGKVEVITSKMLRLQPLYNICVTMTKYYSVITAHE